MRRNTYGIFTLDFSLKSYQEQSSVNIHFSKSWINVTVILESIFKMLVDLVEDQNPEYWKQKFLLREKCKDEDRLQRSTKM